ncbi:hypothetical protein [Arthrobacter sp. H5]|uniref:hypothetical protein n=1 Tax=Arthrobacter sp. H5 TaxID=1267973 RepID=UPI0020A63DE0|nr:hypothetical protein [Arthrobacter sp. H5]
MADNGLTMHLPNPRQRDPDGALPLRGRVQGRGFIDRITIVPRSAPPQFSAVVSDAGGAHGRQRRDTGSDATRYPGRRIRLIWTGQRIVAGIEAGTELAFEGMVSQVDGIPTIHNPRYEIIGRPEDAQ